MRRALAGDPVALQAYGKRMDCVGRILAVQNRRHGRLLTEDELADLAQDVCMLVWRKLAEFEGTAALESWVYRFCYLQFMNARRRKARRIAGPRVEALEEEQGGHAPERRGERFEDLYAAIARLPAEERRVIELRLGDENATFEDLARAEGLPPSTIKTRYYKALERLASCLTRRAPAADAVGERRHA